ncbi:MAG: non-canonical purine NTP pyrophosphatase [Vampirovibrionales bacterium]|nr:non-canonical purine NTP pyrophosphatase [Vampirovibrionales bacterium]
MPLTMMDIIFATTNAGKVSEVQAFFDSLPVHEGAPTIRLHCPNHLPDVDETETTFLGNARLKALAVAAHVTTPFVMAEDSGFSIPALAGSYGHASFPGVHSNRWMTPAIRHELLGINDDSPVIQAHLSAGIYALVKRKGLNPIATPANYTSAWVIANADGEVLFEIEGHVNLWLAAEGTPAGSYGFGYDPMVCPHEEELVGVNAPAHHTLADISTVVKNQFSHRGKAMRSVYQWLLQQAK